MAQIRTVHISELKQDPENARRHNPRNVGQIERSISTDGFGRSGLLAEDLTIAAGNATADASVSAGMEEVIIVDSDGTKPVYVRRTDIKSGSPEFRRLALSDNRAAELAEWGPEVLQSFMDDGLDLEQFWFPDELADLLAGDDDPAAGLTDPDDVPAVPDDPITKPGDVWLLGEHRVMCGDSTVVTDVDRLMQGRKADMVFTDPPYGISFQSNFREKTPQFARIANDSNILDIGSILWSFMADSSVAYVCTRWDVYPQWLAQFAAFKIRNCVVWFKRGGGLGDLDHTYSPNHEFIIVAHKGTVALQGKRHADVWEIGRDSFNDYEHPTQKPVELAEFAIVNHSRSGDLVLDLFGGSGSTLIACEQTGRICYMSELDPKYCDVIVTRWEQFSGNTATRETPGLHDETTHAKAAD